MDSKELCGVFGHVGREYGFDDVGAEFSAFKEFKVRWQRTYKWADFKVSDYMMDAPLEVAEGLARTLFAKITGGEVVPYSDAMRRWVTRDDFVRQKQPIYLRRSRNLTRSVEGMYRDLGASFGRLEAAGLVERDPQLVVSWEKSIYSKRVGGCSVLMKVLSVNPQMDSPDVPEFVLDYALYREYVRMTGGRAHFGETEPPDYCSMDRLFERHREADEWTKGMCLYIRRRRGRGCLALRRGAGAGEVSPCDNTSSHRAPVTAPSGH